MTRICDGCRSSNAAMYCTADLAYMCLACDLKVHAANKLAGRHERVWICDVCEHAPAAVICKADAAALCSSCDVDIHSANPLANRHERVPVTPFFDCPSMIKVAHIHASSVIPNALDLIADFAGPVPEFHFVDQHHQQQQQQQQQQQHKNSIDLFFSPELAAFRQQSRSTGVVPDSSSSMSDISNPYVIDYFCQISSANTVDHRFQAEQCLDSAHHRVEQQRPRIAREERVMRYREKKKNRKFEKTVRYASRKAYAEIRPRVKGRFVKRADVVDQFIVDSVVPSL